MFIVHDIVASRVNLLGNDYVAGLPSPLAMLGFTDAIMRKLDLTPWAGACLPVFHEVIPSAGRTKPEMQPSGGGFAPIEIVEDYIGTVRLSLVLDLPGCTDTAEVQTALMGMRVAGGVIQNRQFKVDVLHADNRPRIRRGYALLPPSDESKRGVFGGTFEEMNRLAQIVYPQSRSPGDGWLVPIAVGYRLIESPETVIKRKNTRDPNVPHVFAEPLAGIGELVSIRNSRITKLDDAELSKLLWSWRYDDSLTLGNAAYLPINVNQDLTNG